VNIRFYGSVRKSYGGAGRSSLRVEEKDKGKERTEDEMHKGSFKLALLFVILI